MRTSMKLVKLIAAAFVIAIMAMNSASAEEWKTIRIGTEGAFPPFNSIDASGNLIGFDIEIGNALCEKMGAECVWVAQEWDGIIPALLAEKYDVIIASMFITEKRKEKVAFSDPYYTAAMTLVAPKDSPITDYSAESLAGMAIGAQNSTTQSDYITAIYPDSDLRFYATQDEVNLDLANGRLDFQVSDLIPMLEWTESENGACCELVGSPITDPQWVGDGVGMAVRKENEDLLAMLNQALADIVADGTYKEINDKYFSLDIYNLE